MKLCKNRSVITIALFLIWIVFFDEISVPKWVNQKTNNKNIRKEIKSVEQKTIDLEQRLKYKNNRDTVEKIARENYYMKRKNEVIYIFD
ncbi:MAG: septum formation initiator family protein [Prevotellaceae bacterium]|nr:septum formation initiator family protein [Prevotellaceae bacterium]